MRKHMEETSKKTNETKNNPQGPSQADIDENKVIAAIGYLGILCLLPLLLKKDSVFAQHHGKQGLMLLICWMILWVVNVIPILGQITFVLGSLGLFILLLLGILNALNGKMWEMPVLGEYAKQIKL